MTHARLENLAGRMAPHMIGATEMAKAITGKQGEVRIFTSRKGAEITASCRLYGGIWAVHYDLVRVRENWSTGAVGVANVLYGHTPEWGTPYTVTHAPTGFAVRRGFTRNAAISLAKRLAQCAPTFPGVFGEPPDDKTLRDLAAVIAAWREERIASPMA